MAGEPLSVLLVEDNPDHLELIIRCIEDQRIAGTICHVADGKAALDYLFRRGEYAEPERSPRPCLVLLDLRLPKIDGLEVLKQVKTSEELHRIPVVILTTSESEKDIVDAYDNHANSYLVKPTDFDKLQNLIAELCSYWLTWNRQPAR